MTHVDNQNKTQAGQNSKDALFTMLKNIDSRVSFTYTPNYKIGYPGYNSKQFGMDAEIVFPDENNEKWLVKVTSSIRSDRVKGNNFDAQNIKILDPSINKIFLVTPDLVTEKELIARNSLSLQLASNKMCSFIDNVMPLNELYNAILEKGVLHLSQGVRANILGNNAEKNIALALMSNSNKEIWNNKSSLLKSDSYGTFQKILLTFGIPKVEEIIINTATTSVPPLQTGGSPKADVNCIIQTRVNTYYINLSVKNTFAPSVTVHEGFALDIINALKLNHDSPLALALLNLELAGGPISLKNNNSNAYSQLEANLSTYNKELIKLFLFGIGSTQSEKQIANILYYSITNTAYTVNSAIDHFLTYTKQFGTPFSWTRPSKSKTPKLQIKAPN